MRWRVLVALGLVLGGSCSTANGPTPKTDQGLTSAPPSRPATAAARAALDRAIAWAGSELVNTDPFTLVVYDYLHRRFEIDEFGSARSLAVDALDSLGETSERRLIDASARVDPAVFADLDTYIPGLLVAAALACDDPGSPAEFERWLRTAVDAGGYDLTHAVVAIGIEAELGCPPTGGEALRGEFVDALSQAVALDVAIDDVSVERMAMLVYLDEFDRIPEGRLADLIEAQQVDGSYTTPEPNFENHTTALAIWVLAAVVERHEGRSPKTAPLVLSS